MAYYTYNANFCCLKTYSLYTIKMEEILIRSTATLAVITFFILITALLIKTIIIIIKEKDDESM
jgi:hypothetical protein